MITVPYGLNFIHHLIIICLAKYIRIGKRQKKHNIGFSGLLKRHNQAKIIIFILASY